MIIKVYLKTCSGFTKKNTKSEMNGTYVSISKENETGYCVASIDTQTHVNVHVL